MVLEPPLVRLIMGDNSLDHHSRTNGLRGGSIDMFLAGGPLWEGVLILLLRHRSQIEGILELSSAILTLIDKMCFVSILCEHKI